MREMLTCFCLEKQEDWEDYLEYIQFAYNSTPHKTTGITPFMLYKNKEGLYSEEFVAGAPPGEKMDYHPYVMDQHEKMREVREFAEQHMKWNMAKSSKNYNLHVHFKNINTGDVVWLYRPNKKVGVSPKLSTFWDGPWVVTKKLTDVIFELRKGLNIKPKIANLSHLKKSKIDISQFPWFEELKKLPEYKHLGKGVGDQPKSTPQPEEPQTPEYTSQPEITDDQQSSSSNSDAQVDSEELHKATEQENDKDSRSHDSQDITNDNTPVTATEEGSTNQADDSSSDTPEVDPVNIPGKGVAKEHTKSKQNEHTKKDPPEITRSTRTRSNIKIPVRFRDSILSLIGLQKPTA